MKRIIYLLLPLVVAAFAAACTKAPLELPEAVNPTAPMRDSALLTLSFSPSVLAEVGASKSYDVETWIHDLNIRLIRKATGASTTYYLPSGTLLQISLPRGQYELYVFANWGQDQGGSNIGDWLTYGGLASGSEESLTYKGMMAMSARMSFLLGDPMQLEVPLKRIAAKATFAVELGPAMSGGRILSTQLFNCTNGVFLFKDTTPGLNQPMYPYQKQDVAAQNVSKTSTTHYIPENLQGTIPSITSPRMRSKEYAPVKAAYLVVRVERNGKMIDYRIYLGENDTNDFNVRRNTHYFYDISIEGENPADLRVSSVSINFYGGLPSTGAGGYNLPNKVIWNSRVAYVELNIEAKNNDPDNVYSVSFRKLNGTFSPSWYMQYRPKEGSNDYLHFVEHRWVACHRGNGKSVLFIAFHNGGSLDNHTTDNLFEFTVRDTYGYAKSFTLQTYTR